MTTRKDHQTSSPSSGADKPLPAWKRDQESATREQPDERSATRELRRQEFTTGSSRGSRHLLMGGLAVVAVAAVAVVTVVLAAGGGEGTTVIAGEQPAGVSSGQAADSGPATQDGAGSDGMVSVRLADITDEAAFYTVQVGGGKVSFFVLRGSDGNVRSAFNACQVCFQEKRGYRQESGVMVCNNCGRSFPVDQVGIKHGGCNPVPLDATADGDSVTFGRAALANGSALFQ